MPNVNVTYEEMRQASIRLQTGHDEMSNKLQELKSLVTSLVNGGYVTDSSSKEFERSYDDFNTGAARVMHGLTGMSTYLKEAAIAFESADAQLTAKLKG